MAAYYVKRTPSGFLELRQERFRDTPNHPHDICGVAASRKQMEDICKLLKGEVNWGEVE